MLLFKSIPQFLGQNTGTKYVQSVPGVIGVISLLDLLACDPTAPVTKNYANLIPMIQLFIHRLTTWIQT